MRVLILPIIISLDCKAAKESDDLFSRYCNREFHRKLALALLSCWDGVPAYDDSGVMIERCSNDEEDKASEVGIKVEISGVGARKLWQKVKRLRTSEAALDGKGATVLNSIIKTGML